LEPRVKKTWSKLGKEPKKLKLKLADIDEIKAEVEKAKKARNDYEKEHPEEKPKEEKDDKKKLKYDITVPFDKSLEFKNGVTVTSLQELVDVLPTLSGSIYNEHINDEHNDVADWIEKTYNDSELASKLRNGKSKKEMMDVLNEDKAKNNKPMELTAGSTDKEKEPEETKAKEPEKKEETKEPEEEKKPEEEKEETKKEEKPSEEEKKKPKEKEKKEEEKSDKKETKDLWGTLKEELDKKGSLDDKLKLLQKAEKENPDNVNIKFSIASLYHRSKDYDKAEKKYKEVLKINPESEKTLFYLGGVLRLENNYKEAANYFRKLHELEPENRLVNLLFESTKKLAEES